MRKFSKVACLLLAAGSLQVASAQAPAPAVPGAADAGRVKAGTYTVDGAHTQVLWRVNHLGFNDYFGLFGDAKGTLTIDPAKLSAATVSIEIPISSLATNSAELNKHLASADFFDSSKFATATFKSTSVAVSGTEAKISGNLTLKGVTKPIVLDTEFEGAGVGPMNKKETIGFHAETKIKRSDFGISYGIPMVPDEVALKISVAFEKAS